MTGSHGHNPTTTSESDRGWAWAEWYAGRLGGSSEGWFWENKLDELTGRVYTFFTVRD